MNYLRKYTDYDYEFVYGVKKKAYKEYVCQCFEIWDELEQRNRFDNFISMVKDNLYIIMYDNKKIGFYNGELLPNGNYEIGNICIILKYQNSGIGTKILKDILNKYEDRDIVLQYFKQNPVGQLYTRLGFKLTGETEFHYQMIKPKRR